MRLVLVLAVCVAMSSHASAQQRKADVEDVDSEGWTALMRAAENGDTAEIASLLARGAKLEASSPKVYDGATPLGIALQFDQHDAAQLLLDRGASVAGKRGTEALVLAARSGFDDILDRLLAAKVSPKGTIALHLAAKFGHVSTIQKLVKAGAVVRAPDHDDQDATPFIVACQEGQVAAARALLAAGANVNDVDGDGTNALHWAVFAERPDEIEEFGTPDMPPSTRRVPHKDAPMVRLLLAKHVKIDVADRDGNTALHEAAMLDAAAAAKLLVAAGANRATKNREGKTAYDLAKERDNSVAPILRRGSKP